MKPIDYLCHRVFGDDHRLGRLRNYIARFDSDSNLVDDAIHAGIIALAETTGDGVFFVSQEGLFRELRREASRCHSKLQRDDV